MKFYWVIRFNGKLNGKSIICNLIVIELDTDSQIPYLFSYDLISYLYHKRSKAKELGPRNGSRISGRLEVKDLFSPQFCPKIKIVKIDSLDLNNVYKIIRPHLREAIAQKINIKKKRRVRKND